MRIKFRLKNSKKIQEVYRESVRKKFSIDSGNQ